MIEYHQEGAPIVEHEVKPRLRVRYIALTPRSEILGRGGGNPNRARPDLWEPRASDHPRSPGPENRQERSVGLPINTYDFHEASQ
jgi:hypothetical protein